MQNVLVQLFGGTTVSGVKSVKGTIIEGGVVGYKLENIDQETLLAYCQEKFDDMIQFPVSADEIIVMPVVDVKDVNYNREERASLIGHLLVVQGLPVGNIIKDIDGCFPPLPDLSEELARFDKLRRERKGAETFVMLAEIMRKVRAVQDEDYQRQVAKAKDDAKRRLHVQFFRGASPKLSGKDFISALQSNSKGTFFEGEAANQGIIAYCKDKFSDIFNKAVKPEEIEQVILSIEGGTYHIFMLTVGAIPIGFIYQSPFGDTVKMPDFESEYSELKRLCRQYGQGPLLREKCVPVLLQMAYRLYPNIKNVYHSPKPYKPSEWN